MSKGSCTQLFSCICKEAVFGFVSTTNWSPFPLKPYLTSLSPRACQVCSPIHPNPSPFLRPFILRWVVVRRGRTPDLTFNTLSVRQMLPASAAQYTPTLHPSPSIHTGWVVVSGNRSPNLTFNTSGSPADATSCVILSDKKGRLLYCLSLTIKTGRPNEPAYCSIPKIYFGGHIPLPI